LEYQQNLEALRLAVIVLRAKSNAYSLIQPLMPQVNKALRSIRPGAVVHVPA
jgi:hypothetical protein